jgi:hypothetical protein
MPWAKAHEALAGTAERHVRPHQIDDVHRLADPFLEVVATAWW